LSTLTKTLIILLTAFSFFLCGAVVVYVGNAQSYKQKYDDEVRHSQDLETKEKHAQTQLKEKTGEFDAKEDTLETRIAELNIDLKDTELQMRTATTKQTSLEEQVQSWVAMVNGLQKTNADKQQLLERTLAELNQLKTSQVKQEKQLQETVRELMEKTAVIESLDQQKRQLQEEIAQLQTRMDQTWATARRQAPPVVTVTPEVGMAKPALGSIEKPGLSGAITAIDTKNSLAEVSVGSAHGVTEGMKFYVTRGQQFVCEIAVFYVDADKAVGDIKNMKAEPRVGDIVATSL
jgi:hypothetical protein